MRYRVSFVAAPVLIGLSLLAGCAKMSARAEGQSSNPPAPLLQYVGEWGMKGVEPGHLSQATSIATDALGNVFIADAGSRFIHKFDPQGTPLLSFQDDWIKEPESIAVDRGGAIYTADATRGGVSIFLPTGDRYRDVKLKTRPGKEDLLGVTVGDDGMVFVLDNDARQVLAYTSSFRYAQTWRPFLNGPDSRSGLGALASGPDGYVYVLDGPANRIVRYTHDGHIASEISARPPGTGRKLGDQLAVGDGYVFVMDGDGLTLHVLGSDGRPKSDFDLAPQLGYANRFIPPLAVSPHKELFVLDVPDSRVLRYRINF